jgi:hypothetical protein
MNIAAARITFHRKFAGAAYLQGGDGAQRHGHETHA